IGQAARLPITDREGAALMAVPLRVEIQVDADNGAAHLEVHGDLTTHTCPELTQTIDRTVRTFESKLVIDLREIGQTEDEALNMLSTHISLLPVPVRQMTTAMR